MSYYWDWYKARYHAFRDAYAYMSDMPPMERDDYGGGDYCCGNEYLDDELYGKVLLIYLLATLSLLLVYLLFVGTFNNTGGRRRREAIGADSASPSSPGDSSDVLMIK